MPVFLTGLLGLAPLARAGHPGPDPLTETTAPLEEQEDSSPWKLKEQVRVTVETNLPPAAGGTNQPQHEKKMDWNFRWRNWDGLHVEISQKTPLEDPLKDMRARIYGTNDQRMLHLEEMKMSGKIGAKLALDGAAFVTGKQFEGFDATARIRCQHWEV